jgi:p-aminobenzoyl-glutamate transporter AbgT
MAIRWPSHFGDTSRLGTLLAKWIFHIAHVFLLVLCVWVIFDSPISPRYIFAKHELQSVLPLLTFYYLSALAIGYFAGYFLLVFRPIVTRSRRATALATGSHRLATISVIAALLALIAGLFLPEWPIHSSHQRFDAERFRNRNGRGTTTAWHTSKR